MTPPTLKQLAEKATPGNWEARYMGSSDWAVHSVDTGAMVHYAGEVGREQAEANNKLSARCSPSVMLAVVSALENAKSYILETGNDKNMAPMIGELESALNLLNGKAP